MRTRLRILMVGREYPPFSVGGVATHTRSLARALVRRGHMVEVISYGYPGKAPRVDDGVAIHWLPPTSSIISRSDEGVARDARVPIDILRLVSYAQWLIRRRSYDVVHVQEPYVGGLVLHEYKVTTIHDTSYGEMRAIFHTGLGGHNARRLLFFASLGTLMEYLSMVTSRVVIAPSPQVRDELVHVYHGSSLAEIIVVPNGVEEPAPWEPSREEAKKLLGLGDRLVVFATAQHVARKRLETLVEAAALLRDKWAGKALVVIGGQGPLTPRLRELARKHGLGGFVVFTGWIPGDRLPLYYRAADVFVLTSEYEAGPITLLEAGIRGAALVSTRIPLFPALLRHGYNALLYDVGDYKTLARHLDLLLSEPRLREELGRRAIEFAKRFTWDRVAALTEAVYRRAIAG